MNQKPARYNITDEDNSTEEPELWSRLIEARRTAPVSQWRAKLLTAS